MQHFPYHLGGVYFVQENHANTKSVLVIGCAPQTTSMLRHTYCPLPDKPLVKSIPDESTSKLVLAVNHSDHPLPDNSAQFFSSHNGDKSSVIQIHKIQTYTFTLENPIPHHGIHTNSCSPSLHDHDELESISFDTTVSTNYTYAGLCT